MTEYEQLLDQYRDHGRAPTEEEFYKAFVDRMENQPPLGADAYGNVKLYDKDKIPPPTFEILDAFDDSPGDQR